MPERRHFLGQLPTFTSPWPSRYAVLDPQRAHLVVVLVNVGGRQSGPRASHIDLTIASHRGTQPHAHLTKASSRHQPAPHHPVPEQARSAAATHTPNGLITHTDLTNWLSGEVHVGKEDLARHGRGHLATFWRPKR